MMVMIQHPTTIYLNEAKAAEVVAKLNEDAKLDDDGWTYAVKCRIAGKFAIEIIDADGEFIGYL